MNTQIKVRFAPSPTGFLHVGGLRTALFNFLFARKNEGQFLLRIEDTDKSREVAGAVENILETLKFFELPIDEEPLFQSSRLKIYQEHAQILLQKDAAYKCYCSEERIAELKKQADAEKRPFRYDKHCLKISPSPDARLPARQEGRAGERFVIRQNVPAEGITEFDDLVHGKIKIENHTLDDGILVKSDGWPVYNFANVVDDHLLGITHVIRGEEFIPSTPKHILLYQSFGWEVPKFAHLPLLLDKNRKKLSKREGDVAVKEYLEKGYLPEALLNFVALLGWNPKTVQEIFSLEQLINEFDLAKVNRAGAVFDLQKLNFINRQWQKQLNLGTNDPLAKRAGKLLSERAEERVNSVFFEKVWKLILERISGPSDLEEKLPEFYFFFEDPEYEAKLLIWKDTAKQTIKKNLAAILDFINQDLRFNSSIPAAAGGQDGVIAGVLQEFISKNNLKAGEVLWPLRVALSGLKNSPGPFEIMEAFLKLSDGREIIVRRIQKAIDKLI